MTISYIPDGYLETLESDERDYMIYYDSATHTNGRNAFWSIRVVVDDTVDAINIISAWGSIGARCQIKKETKYYSGNQNYKAIANRAIEEAKAKMNEKLNKGYQLTGSRFVDYTLASTPPAPGSPMNSFKASFVADGSITETKAVVNLIDDCTDLLDRYVFKGNDFGAHEEDMYFEFHPTNVEDYVYVSLMASGSETKMRVINSRYEEIRTHNFSSVLGSSYGFDEIIQDIPFFLGYITSDNNVCLLRYLGTPLAPEKSLPTVELTWEQQSAVMDVTLTLFYNNTGNIYDPSLLLHRADYADTDEMKERFRKMKKADNNANIIVGVNPRERFKRAKLYRIR